jgi:CubicO group peptidase (beta-lactamase class C family)
LKILSYRFDSRLVGIGMLFFTACNQPDHGGNKLAPSVKNPPMVRSVVARASSSVQASAVPTNLPAPPVVKREIDPEKLKRLVAEAKETDSDALVISYQDKLLGSWKFTEKTKPIQTMSITKTVLSLAAGMLVDDQKLNIEQNVNHWFPQWKHGRKSRITVFHLLTHSSGIDPGSGTQDIYRSKDFVEFTLQSKTIHDPGARYLYNNRGYNLVAGILGKAAGKAIDRYVAQRLFQPLGISKTWWSHDHAGNPHGLAGLHILPEDLLKLGQLVEHQGQWEGKQVVSAAWIHRSTELPGPVQPEHKVVGIGWTMIPAWSKFRISPNLIAKWRKAGVDPEVIAVGLQLVNQVFATEYEFYTRLRMVMHDSKLVRWNKEISAKGLPEVDVEMGPTVGTYAIGSLGQYLVVIPKDKLVAVRMRRSPKHWADRQREDKKFHDFAFRVRDLIVQRSTDKYPSAQSSKK